MPFNPSTLPSVTKGGEQYLRKCTLIVQNRELVGLDLSQLQIKFSVKRSDTMTPNTADIYVYNLAPDEALRIKKEFTQVTLQAGYEANYGVIFKGNIKQVIIGRESATTSFINIIAGDGDRAYNYAIVNRTIAAGASQQDQVNASLGSMAAKGVGQGHMIEFGTVQLPRGKVMYGNANEYLRSAAETSQSTWSIQDEKVFFVSKRAYLPGEAVRISAETGMIGYPQQTNEGVNVKTLLNPSIQVMGRINLVQSDILEQKLNLNQIAAVSANSRNDNERQRAVNALIPRRLNADGMYYVLVMEHIGDTRGQEWYTSMVCLDIDVTSNPFNSVEIGAGGNG